MSRLHDVLESCLNNIEQGVEVETVLSRYPELADELRPMLDASLQAKEMAVPAPSEIIVKRNRTKLLQRVAQIREEQSASNSRRVWSVPLRRALVTMMVLAMLFVSSTNLVRAASTTLPGDNLYPVKRTWEDLSIFFTFDSQEREALELEHENERLDEVHELFAEGRSADVDFAGYVTLQSGNEWRVSGISVFVSSETRLPDQQVEVGAAVRVRGQIQAGMSIMAERIELLPPGSKLPEVEDNELEDDDEEHEESNQQTAGDTGVGTEIESMTVTSLNGVVNSIESGLIVVNGIQLNLRHAEIIGTIKIGVSIVADGYYDSNGEFIVTMIKVGSSEANSDNKYTSNDDDKNDDDKNDDDKNDGEESDH